MLSRSAIAKILLSVPILFLLAFAKTSLEKMPDQASKKYLALGDSYTIGESVPEHERYPVQTVNLLNKKNYHFSNPDIIATTGWTTADLVKAVDNHHFNISKYDIVSLLIGVNNQYQGKSRSEYKEQFTALLKKAISLAGDNASHVIVISIPDYSITPFASGSNTILIAKEIDEFNEINKQIAVEYKTNYIDVTGESRKAAADHTLIASDGLHFSGKEYAIWSNKISAEIENILK